MGWYTNEKFAEAQPAAIDGKWLVLSRLAKRTLPTVGQQSIRNLPVLAQLLCAIWEDGSNTDFIENAEVLLLYS